MTTFTNYTNERATTLEFPADSGEPEKYKSTLVSRNITVLGHRTSVRLEPEMWAALKDISRREGGSIHEICSLVHLRKGQGTSLTAAIRVFLLLYYRASTTEEGHERAGHGNFQSMKFRARLRDGLWHINRHHP